VIRAMRELDNPIDFVGGTAWERLSPASARSSGTGGRCSRLPAGAPRKRSARLHPTCCVTLVRPEILAVITSIAGDLDIEDAWLPFFCVSASLTRAEMKVHSSGSAARSVIASSRAPGLFPPVSWADELLVDGGLVNMVPSDVMRDFVGQGTVMSVDVSPAVEYGKPDFGLSFSGWQALRRRFRPFSGGERIPG